MGIGDNREHGTIVSVSTYDPDHDAHYATIMFDFGSSCQGFVSPVLDANGPLSQSFYGDLLSMFGVGSAKDLVGRQCFVLRCFDGLNEPIEGLEVDGKRFTCTAWRRKHFPDTESVLARRRKSLESTHERALRQAQEAVNSMARLESRYVDWDK